MQNKPYELTDPYGNLTYAVGSGDDFWCFDYHVDEDKQQVLLHAVINSETAQNIQNAERPFWVTYDEAVSEAIRLVYAALDWCVEGGDKPVRHTVRGWNQDPMFFARTVAQAVAQAQGKPYRRTPRKNGKTPNA